MSDIVDAIKANKKIILNVIKMTIIVSAIYVVTYAWFTNGVYVNVNNISVSTKAVNDIKISLDNGQTWSNLASLDIGSDFAFNSEITSDGITFYKASHKEENGTPTNFVPAVANKDYLEFNIMFKSKMATTIFLDKVSTVVPATGTDINALIGTENIVRKSTLGDFSRDLVAGAVRVAFIDNNLAGTTYTPKTTTSLVWAPNKNYELAILNNEYVAYINSTNNQTYDYLKVTNETTFTPDSVLNIKDNINASYDTRTAGGDPLLAYASIKEANEEAYIKKVTVRVWVEGNDRDAVTPLKGGLFKIKLNFVGLDKQFDNVAPNVTADTNLNKIVGFSSAMEYSFDNGNNWFNYTYNNDPTFDEGSTVYVRKTETNDVFASSYKTLNF